MCFAPLFEKFMQAIFQTKKKSSLFFIRFAYAQHLPPQGEGLTKGRLPPGGKLSLKSD